VNAPDGEGRAGDDRDDRALLAAHVDGDPQAFGILFARHRDRMWAVALRTCGDPEEAADALQDAMIAAFRRAGSFRGDAAVTTWLHRIVVNASLDRLRRRKVRAADALPDDLDEHGGRGSTITSATDADDPVVASERAEVQQQVLTALRSLPAEQRAALVLVDMEGYSVEDTAALLGVAVGTVKSRCSRGRARLAPLLATLRASRAGPAGNSGDPPRVPSEHPETPPDPGGGEHP
jgi:RNA polymerase sigma-70 factor (ECF subfamily)